MRLENSEGTLYYICCKENKNHILQNRFSSLGFGDGTVTGEFTKNYVFDTLEDALDFYNKKISNTDLDLKYDIFIKEVTTIVCTENIELVNIKKGKQLEQLMKDFEQFFAKCHNLDPEELVKYRTGSTYSSELRDAFDAYKNLVKIIIQ